MAFRAPQLILLEQATNNIEDNAVSCSNKGFQVFMIIIS